MVTTSLGSNPACQMSVPSSQLLIIGKKEEVSQGKDICKCPFLLWGWGVGASHVEQIFYFQTPAFLTKLALCSQGAPSHGVTGLCPSVSSLNLVSSLLLELKLRITAGFFYICLLLPLMFLFLWCNKLQLYTVSREHFQNALEKCSPSISIAFKSELTR